jgi:putative DNA-invertase from lambdoid prophage Rac
MEPTSVLRTRIIERAKANDGRSYLGRKLDAVRAMLSNQALGVAQIAKDAGPTRQTVYRIKDDPAGAEAALSAWEC